MSKVLDENSITLDLKADTKVDAIKELTSLLKKTGKVTDESAFIDDVLYRETEGITGLGQGVAIPHGKSTAVNETSLAIGVSKNPIAWESLDDKPVNIIILFAVRNQDSNVLHIKLLQHVAILLAKDDFIKELHTIKSKKKLIKMFN